MKEPITILKILRDYANGTITKEEKEEFVKYYLND